MGRTRKYGSVMSGPCSRWFNLKAVFPHNSLQSICIPRNCDISVSPLSFLCGTALLCDPLPLPFSTKANSSFFAHFPKSSKTPNTVGLSSILVIEQNASRTIKNVNPAMKSLQRDIQAPNTTNVQTCRAQSRAGEADILSCIHICLPSFAVLALSSSSSSASIRELTHATAAGLYLPFCLKADKLKTELKNPAESEVPLFLDGATSPFCFLVTCHSVRDTANRADPCLHS